jgi:flagellar hook-associated protein 2
MANNISNSLNTRLRLTGMASGLDTESMIKQLMKAEQYKVDRVKQEKQVLQWKRNDYRNMTNILKGFSDSFMNVLSSSDMRSANSYKAFTVNSSNSAVVSATANADAVGGTHEVAVTQLAKAAYAVGTDTVSAALQGTAIDATTLASITGKDFNMTLNGITKNIKLTGDYTIDPANPDIPAAHAAALNNLKTELDTKITAAFGSGKITVEISADNKLSFSSADSKIALTSGTSDALAQLGFVSGSTNRLNLSAKLSTSAEFKINGISFTADTTKTMKDVISEVNSSAAGVTLSYSEATDKFTLTSKVKGAGDAIVVEQKDINGNFIPDINFLGIKTTDIQLGQDAKLIYDGTAITRNDNAFTLDGIKFNLLAVSQLVDANDPTKGLVKTSITLDQDVDKVFKNILSFVDKYNELVGKLTGELGEVRDKDYQPLTEDQKASMSETDIKTWEAKASSGMLRNDSLLSGVLNEMRSAIYASIEGISEGVFSIGIKTGDYTQKGKLIIDETKLKDAIKNKPDLVANIFNKESDINYSVNLSSTDKTTRYKENGIVNRLYDIIQKNVTTLRNDKGQKGLLIEKAGYSEDYIDISSYISKQIKDKDTQIDTLIERLQNKEDSYYRKFSALESAMSKMSSQSSWISQQFGGGQ